MLIDASKLGEKIKDDDNQKTVLRPEEVKMIEDTFINQDIVEDFSVKVSYDQITKKNYSLSAGQYFEVKIEFVELSKEEYDNKMTIYSTNLDKLFANGKLLEQSIKKRLEELKYEN